MEHPSRAISAFAILVATPVALMVLSQVRRILREGELRREAPLTPLTRAGHPIVYWGIVGAGTAGAVIMIGAIAVAVRFLLMP
jgi:hypothetical protein